jgi:hypothetical protein
MGGTLLGSLAAGFVGSIISQQFLGSMGDDALGEDNSSAEAGDQDADASTKDDFGGYDSGDYGGDFGGDF